MKTFQTSGKCPKCGCQLFTNNKKDYSFICKKCNIKFQTEDVKENISDFYEISIKMSSKKFTKELSLLSSVADKYNCIFLGHDDEFNLTDFGWQKGFPDSKTINKFVRDIETLVK